MRVYHFYVIILVGFFSFSTYGQTFNGPLPSAADPGRIEPQKTPIPAPSLQEKPKPPDIKKEYNIPEAAKSTSFLLKEVHIQGNTAFSESELSTIYSDYINRHITLDLLWVIADKITSLYREKGYFLSRAYVPAQEIDQGNVQINIVEGYISEVEFDDKIEKNYYTRKIIQELLSNKPLSVPQLEAAMMAFNAIPGKKFRSVLDPIKNAEDGTIKLVLISKKEEDFGSFSIDNYGSRFIGPYQALASYQTSLLPLHQTNISALSSIGESEIQYFSLFHTIYPSPNWEISAKSNYVSSKPGASLAVNDIKSTSIEFGIAARYHYIRQWEEDLSLYLELSGKNVNGNILENDPLTRDRIRTLKGEVDYSLADKWNGFNTISFTVNQGLPILSSSERGDSNLSRSEAEPDYTSARIDYNRQQKMGKNWLAIAGFSAQAASAPLFSAGEFGYGGQTYGRAYDPSEITGDHGVSAGIELRYLHTNSFLDIKTTPYTFYDIGKTWNEDSGNTKFFASSAGLGTYINHKSGINANLGIAWPLTRPVNTPIYGNKKNPRFLFQISTTF